MNQHLQSILNFIQRDESLSAEEKSSILKSLKDADKELEITTFKLDRTEKVKHTTTILLEETIEELEHKRKAVEAQNRELEIESSLERVRTVAMGMNKPDDMLHICQVISQQMEILGTKEIRNVQTAIFYADKGTYMNYEYYRLHDKSLITEVDYRHDTMTSTFALKMMKGPGEFFSESLKEKALLDWVEYQKTTPQFVDPYLAGAASLNYYWFSLGPIALGISTYALLNEEEINLFKRFRNVFELSYRRYLDIEKAIAQAKEAQIQLAMERVRARTMAMHKSDELTQASNLLYHQMESLDVPIYSAGYCIWEDDKQAATFWMSSQGILQPPFKAPLTKDPIFIHYREAYLHGEEFYAEEYSGEELAKMYQYIMNLPDVKEMAAKFNDTGLQMPPIPATQVNHVVYFSNGFLLFITPKPVPEAHDIFKRFGKVFEQTYTRFLDLQKAETQAREAQIEAALERVRSRSMAMQKSDELAEVSQVLNEQLGQLNFKNHVAGFLMDYWESNDFNVWRSDPYQLFLNKIRFPYFDHPIFKPLIEAKEKGLDFYTITLTFEEKNKWLDYAIQYIPSISEEVKEILYGGAGYAGSGALMKNVGLFIENFDGVPFLESENAILMRFGKVFEQTYTRFNDLKQAEAQAMEAIKRASVDRVRAEIASMRTTNDLERITPLIWNELTTLDVPFIRCGVFIMDEEQQQVQTHLSTPDGKAIAGFRRRYYATKQMTQIVTHWQQKKIFKDHMDAAAFAEYTKNLVREGAVASGGKYVTESHPTDLYLHFLPFLQGMLYVGNTAILSDDQLQLVQNLADAFSTAYARYEDFNKLEAAKQQVDKTLLDLKQTQTQLIQSEKMASLGELTAGIAHEIQNPLNFVNNFSEVNKELLAELKDEIQKGNIDEVNAIADDVIGNEEKINHHGKRADAIVKGMLQHSRTSTGVKEPTDINALADEYLRLAYHGLRAKDKSLSAGQAGFNATMKTDFDESIGKINIIPQDIGRALLNLITNAFYAVQQKQKETAGKEEAPFEKGYPLYEPSVSVITKRLGDQVSISIGDNGNGIPQNIVEKIFQPFFTTKPTGQGTGLGLSLSYDIVKAHGGEIKVETREREGSNFIIQLPVV